MSKPVFITSDSTCDLSPELVERLGIRIIPLHVLLGDESYLDGVSFTPEMIFDRYKKDQMLPKTSAVTPQEFEDFFRPIVEEGYEIVHFDITSELSGTYQNACIAAQETGGVYPIDTRLLTTGMGLMMIEACRMRDEGCGAAEIAEAMQALIPKISVSFVLDTLEYLWKGGRCSGVAAFGANLLNLKPCIEMKDGLLVVGKKYRGSIRKVYLKYIREQLSGKKIWPDVLFITCSDDLSDDDKKELEAVIRSVVDVKEILFTKTGCTITAHCGPGTLGVLYREM